MIRRVLLLGAVAALTAVTTMAPGNSPTIPTLGANAATQGKKPMVTARNLAALVYDETISEAEVIYRSEVDAESLGLEVVRTLAFGNVVIVRASMEEAERRVAAAENLPICAVWPVTHRKGVQVPDSLVVFTDRLQLRFASDVSEADKQAFCNAAGYELGGESAAGDVIVRTAERPGLGMIDYARQVADSDSRVEKATFEFLMAVEPTIQSNSIQVEDPLFEDFQWYLWNSSVNTNFGFGVVDEDIDAPRAWMINQFLSPQDRIGTPFGFSGVDVAIFDSGIQLEHPDLQGAFGSSFGFDAVDGGPPSPGLNLLGAHGTAMAGLVSAQHNQIGIIGAAPDLSLYASRVFGEDYSTSNIRIINALRNTISANVDVNVHPYTMKGITDLDADLTTELETAFRESFESGRGGLGTSNVASAGNFFSQVEYPASSPWTFAVGGVTAEGNSYSESNRGGVGIDFVMPSYFIGTNSSYSEFGTGLVTTDLTGRNGVAQADSGTPGNETGDYAALGRVELFTETSVSTSDLFSGTSVSAALAGAVIGMMYSDVRYDELKPFNTAAIPGMPTFGDPTANYSREAYRSRAPLRPDDNSILAKMKNYSDLPGEPLASVRNVIDRQVTYDDPEFMSRLGYVNQSSEDFGFGRPNIARAIAPPSGLPSPDSGFESALTEFYNWTFDQTGSFAPSEDELLALQQGWTTTPIIRGEVLVSPVLYPTSNLYFADQSQNLSIPPASGQAAYVWIDSVPEATPEAADGEEDQPNYIYNPEGTYLSNTPLDLISPILNITALPPSETGISDIPTTVPLLLKVQMAHELGIQNGSSSTFGRGVSNADGLGVAVPQFEEVDTITWSVNYTVSEESRQIAIQDALDNGEPIPSLSIVSFPVGVITGDSSPNPKQFLEQATNFREDEESAYVAAFRGRGSLDNYTPWVDESEMLIREYRFFVPPPPAFYDQIQIRMDLNPGASHLPTWRFDFDDFAWEQIFNVTRDYKGFVFYGASLSYFDPAYMAYLDDDNLDLGTGNFPTWSASKHDIFAARVKEETNQSGQLVVRRFVTAYDPTPYIVDPATVLGSAPRNPTDFFELLSPITGLAAHPNQELLALTSSGGEAGEGALLTMTNDGINLREIVSGPLGIGAREPSWARNGQQILYSSPDALRLANLNSDGTVQVETILGADHPYLTDFHTPVFDRTAGIVYFTARRKPIADAEDLDSSLNLYLVARNGRIFSFEEEEGTGYALPIISGWEGVDIFDLELATDGVIERLVFSAFAEQAPTFVPVAGGGYAVDIPAVPSAESNIFILENVEATSGSRFVEPVYTKINQSVEGTDNPSARWPRVSPDGEEIVWVSLQQPVAVDEFQFEGSLSRQRLPARGRIASDTGVPPEPTPAVTPAPPVPTPIDNSNVVFSGDFEFATSTEGFDFNTAGFTNPSAVGRFEFVNDLPKEVVPGIVGFIASSFDELEGQNILVATVNFVAKANGTANIGILTTPPRDSVTEDAGGHDLPTIYGGTSTVRIVSRGEVEPARIFLDDDSFPVEAGDFVTVVVRLDANNQPVSTVRGYLSFDTSVLVYNSGLVNPSFFDRQIADGTLEITSNNSNNVFGYWKSPSSTIQVLPNSLFLMRTELSASAGTQAAQVPTVRLRVNSENLESAFTVETNSFGDLSLSPNTTARKINDLLFRPPATLFNLNAEALNYEMAFDMLNFIPGKDPFGGVALHQIDLYRLDEDPRYIALWGFEVPATEGSTGATVSFEALGAGGVSGDIALSVKNCCTGDSEVIVNGEPLCAFGNSVSGVSIRNKFLVPGYYTVSAVLSRDTDVILNWSSDVALSGNLGDDCDDAAGQGEAQLACNNRMPLSGLFGANVTQAVTFDGSSFYPTPSCATEGKTVIKSKDLVYEADFRERSARDEWSQGPIGAPFSLPDYPTSQDSLGLSVIDPASTFGFWTSDETAIPVGDTSVSDDSPVLIYRATYRVVAETESNPLALPDIRLRLATNDFQRSVSTVLVSLTDGVTAPVAGQPREVQVYMVMESVPQTMSNLIAAFDVLSFYPPEIFGSKPVGSQPVELERVKIERVHIPNYPLVEERP